MRIGFSPRSASRMLACAAAMTVVAGAARAQPVDPFYERAFVLAVQARCDLFAPRVEQALQASALQARGAALREGRAASDLTAVSELARARADRTSCGHPDLKQIQSRVTAGFEGWSRTPRMSFDGGWSGDRYSSARADWRLVQASATGGSSVRFGLAGQGPLEAAPIVVVSFVGRPRPYAARIVMRDVDQAPRVWLTGGGLPPEPARRVFFAQGWTPATPELLAQDRRQGETWTFPVDMTEALSALDPREVFVVEFLFRDDSVATARFTAGDFAAGRAFLAMGPV